MAPSGTSGFSASGGDDDILPALYHVGARGCGAAEWQFSLKEGFTILLVEDSKGLIRRGTDEY